MIKHSPSQVLLKAAGGDVEMELIGGAYIWSLMKKETVGISHDVSLHKINSLHHSGYSGASLPDNGPDPVAATGTLLSLVFS